ncbi:hypothetical protein CCMA1212_006025 [Trichoderma ghanense]|uniref:Uncharacterized protein n=1 Tax=Trichoderma ghanense TaxID=65468 RepID=A0ABY2H1Y4_9HYPO
MEKKKRKKMEAAKQKQRQRPGECRREKREPSQTSAGVQQDPVVGLRIGRDSCCKLGVTRMGEGVTNTVDSSRDDGLGTWYEYGAKSSQPCTCSASSQAQAAQRLRVCEGGEGGNQTRRERTWMDTLTARCRLGTAVAAELPVGRGAAAQAGRAAQSVVHPDGRLGLRGVCVGGFQEAAAQLMQMETRAAGVRYWLESYYRPCSRGPVQGGDKARRPQAETEIARCRYRRHRTRLDKGGLDGIWAVVSRGE